MQQKCLRESEFYHNLISSKTNMILLIDFQQKTENCFKIWLIRIKAFEKFSETIADYDVRCWGNYVFCAQEISWKSEIMILLGWVSCQVKLDWAKHNFLPFLVSNCFFFVVHRFYYFSDENDSGLISDN